MWLKPRYVATPVTEHGGALLAPSEMAVGQRITLNGVEMVCVEFTPSPDVSGDVALYLDGYTDHHREDLSGSIRHVGSNSPVNPFRVLLPADGIACYGFIVADQIDPYAGRTREGWLGLLQQMVDTPGIERIWRTIGAAECVWRGPLVESVCSWPDPLSPGESAGVDGWHEHLTEVMGEKRSMWLRVPDIASKLLVIFDGEMWRANRLGWALQRRHVNDYAVCLIDVENPHKRNRDLPDYERSRALVSAAIKVASSYVGREFSSAEVTVCGQSFGGLAAVSAVVGETPLSGRAICQSPSWWYAMNAVAGTAAQALGEASLEGRKLVVHIGTQEGIGRNRDMLDGAYELTKSAENIGAETKFRVFRGGHSWAAWREALMLELLADSSSPNEVETSQPPSL